MKIFPKTQENLQNFIKFFNEIFRFNVFLWYLALYHL